MTEIDISTEQFLRYGLFGAGLLALAIQLYYLLFVYGRLATFKHKNSVSEALNPNLSVIICARNEEESLKQNLPLILAQNYPNFEVVLVNEYSDDDSKWYLKSLSGQHKNLKVVEIAQHVQHQQGKKFALTLGIKAAQHEHLVFTDADCRPESDTWLQNMASAFGSDKEIVLGYALSEKTKGISNWFHRFKTFYSNMNYLSYTLKKSAYRGIGKNMAYKKSLFFQNKGFAAHMHLRGGEDQLFVNQNANRNNTVICIHPDAHIWTEPTNKEQGYQQKNKWRSEAAAYYKPHHKRRLALQQISAILFYGCMIISLVVFPTYYPYILGAYVLRLVVQILVFYPIMKRLRVRELIWTLPISDILYRFRLRTQ